MFDKVKQLGQLKKMRDQALKIQKQLAAETIELDEDDELRIGDRTEAGDGIFPGAAAS